MMAELQSYISSMRQIKPGTLLMQLTNMVLKRMDLSLAWGPMPSNRLWNRNLFAAVSRDIQQMTTT